jgi:hypothetical protein
MEGKMNMKKLYGALVLTGVSALASADSPHFIKGPTGSLDSSGDYVVSFKEAGLGNTPITYSLTAGTAVFTFQCYNPANHTPQGDPNGQSFSNVTTFETLTPRNGQITGSIMLSPEKGSASCQGNAMTLCLTAVSYSGVVFKEETTPLGPYNLPPLQTTFRNPICGF